MAPDTLITGLRIYSLVVAIIVAIIGTTQIRLWRSYMMQNQLAWMGLALFNGATIYGLSEQLAKHTPGGTRSYVTALAVTFALHAVAYTPTRRFLRWWRARQVIRRYERR